MRKVLLLILAIGVIGGAYAQNKYAIKDLRQSTARSLKASTLDLGSVMMLPLKPRHFAGPKTITPVAIGTSANVYSILLPQQNYLDVDGATNTILFTARQGGPWGGSGNSLWCKHSNNFGASWDSVPVVSTTGNFRYPSGVIYNPTGNTDMNNMYSVFCGPITDGTGWIDNYFGSIKFDGTGIDLKYVAAAADTSELARIGLSSGNGYFHVMTPVAVSGAFDYSYWRFNNGIFNTGSNTVDWTVSSVNPLFKMRTFSNATVKWQANELIAYYTDGQHGYYYTYGADSAVDPYNTSIPLTWETFDGGTTWTQNPVYTHFSDIPNIKYQVWPTRATMFLDSSQWVIRPDWRSGAVGDESNYPGVVDAFGNLHLACVIEGRYSAHPDSLGYGFANHPHLLFDVYQDSGGWNAVFIDTIRTDVVESANSGYGTGTNAVGWEHMIGMSKSPDGLKIFVTWTDTDPTIDTTNIMPEVWGLGWDIMINMKTAPVQFSSGQGNFFFLQTSRVCVNEGTLYKIPATSFDIYESNQDPINPVKHYFLNGIQFDESEFVNDCFPYSTSTPNIAQNGSSISQNYPNPAKGSTTINVSVKENANINLVVTNILGQKIYETAKNASTGTHNFTLDTKNWGKGIYFYTVSAGNNKTTKKMLVE
ncbi:MAG: T9SS type A sorting domain-containing protein [Bacteroidia bacterium]|nr:T9SS type A sorting domain-containing protein [Bacteroidia bacterium]